MEQHIHGRIHFIFSCHQYTAYMVIMIAQRPIFMNVRVDAVLNSLVGKSVLTTGEESADFFAGCCLATRQ